MRWHILLLPKKRRLQVLQPQQNLTQWAISLPQMWIWKTMILTHDIKIIPKNPSMLLTWMTMTQTILGRFPKSQKVERNTKRPRSLTRHLMIKLAKRQSPIKESYLSSPKMPWQLTRHLMIKLEKRERPIKKFQQPISKLKGKTLKKNLVSGT